jgi:tRNA-dihydrouridine synthase B
MIGRGAQGRPWVFREINHFLITGEKMLPPSLTEVQGILFSHVIALHQFYGDFKGVMIARKHVSWYIQSLAEASEGFSSDFTADQGKAFRAIFNKLVTTSEQLLVLNQFFDEMTTRLVG